MHAHDRATSIDCVVPITEDPGYLPTLRSMVPNDQELGFTKAFFGTDIAEPLLSFFDGSIVLDWKYLQASCDQYTPEMAAYIRAGFIDVVFSGPRDATPLS